MRTARPAREYDIRVSEWEPVPAGARGKGAGRLALYRRVKIAFGNLAGQPARPPVPCFTDIAEMQPIRNAPETYPGSRDIIANVPLTWGDAPPRSWPGSAANPGELH